MACGEDGSSHFRQVNPTMLAKKSAKIVLISLILGTSVLTENPPLLADKLKSVGVQLDIPPEFKKVAQVKQRDVWYDQGWRHPKLKLEIRVRIDDMRPQLEEYEFFKKNPDKGMRVHPNNVTQGLYQAMLMNISQAEDMPKFAPFPTEAVGQEFHANSGGTSFFPAKSNFSKGYKYVMANYLQRDNLGVIYVFYLVDDPQIIQTALEEYFHIVRFADPI